MTVKDKYAIAGLGVTAQGKVPGISARKFQAEAVRLALHDAGLTRDESYGYIYENYRTAPIEDAPPRMLGLPVNFYWMMDSGGVTCLAGLSAAIGALEMGLADYVVVVYGSNAASVASSPAKGARPFAGVYPNMASAYGQAGPIMGYALMARAHMERYGTTSRQLGAISVAEREWAVMNPEALFYGKPITLEDHQNSRLVVDPLRLLDCSPITDGGAAFVVTTAARARDLRRPPVYIKGMGMGSQLNMIARGHTKDTFLGLDCKTARDQAFGTAGVTLGDIDVFQIYDAFTILTLLQLEDYGFCEKGEGGPFVASGDVIGPGTKLPVNTSGGQMGWGYMEGFTPMIEGIRQIRGEGGAGQVKDAALCLVTGSGAYAHVSHGPGHARVLSQSCAVLGK